MITDLTKGDLIAFEESVKEAFLARYIHAPIHLSGGNEDQVLEVFEGVRSQDWVFSTWRSHYHALLKGVPPERLFQAILDGRSMYYQDKEHKFMTSALVGGILPIALGVALGVKRLNLDEQIWVFVGDMAARTGICHEATEYARAHYLPLKLVIEDNGVSTNTPTLKVWGESAGDCICPGAWEGGTDDPNIHGDNCPQFRPPVIDTIYDYKRVWPHTGVGEWVTFG